MTDFRMGDKLRLICGCICIILIALLPQDQFSQNRDPSPGLNPFDLNPLIERLKTEVPELMQREKIPGLSISLMSGDGIHWMQGFGSTRLGGDIAVDGDTLFSLQSMSKTFTAAAVMLAVQQGLVSLDSPITTYLPGFSVKSRFEENAATRITLRMLLNHSAGFPHEAPVGNNFVEGKVSFEEHVASISRTWLRYPVGERYAYSNLGIDLAGYILQVKAGKPFAVYVKEKLLEPLGMARSSFDPGEIEKFSNRAAGHDKFLKELPLHIPMVPAGGLYSNASELSAFIRFFLNRGIVEGGELLKQGFVDEMTRLAPLTSSGMSGYALGIVKVFRNDTYCLTHSGAGFGFSSTMKWYPEYDIGLLILSNADWNTRLEEMSDRILDDIVGGRKVEKPLLSDPSAVLQYLGRYRMRRFGQPLILVELIRRGSTLILKDSSRGSYHLHEFETGLFSSVDGEVLDLSQDIPTWRNIPMEKILILPLEKILLVFVLFMFTSAFIGWSLGRLLRREKREYMMSVRKRRKVAFKLTGLYTFLAAAYLAGVLRFSPFIIRSGLPLNPSMPFSMKLLLVFPVIALIFTFVMVLIAFNSWKRSSWTRLGRLHYSLVTFTSVLYIILLLQWKLLLTPFS